MASQTEPLAVVLAVLGLAAPARAAEEAGADAAPSLVVYDLEAEEGLEALGKQLTDALLVHLGAKPGLVVVGESELKVMLAHERDKEALRQCQGESACLARISRAADASQVVTGRVGRLGETLLVTLKLSDATRGVVTRGESAAAEREEDLTALTRGAVDRLLDLEGASTERFRLTVAPSGTKVAVLDLGAYDVSEGLGKNLTQLLSLELKKFEGLGVISRDEIRTLLRFESEKQILQCTNDTSCLLEIGGALGVDYLVSGSVGRLGDAFVIALKLMDIGKAAVVSRVSESFQGAESHLPQALRFATWSLLGKPADGTGSLRLSANVDEGQLVLDGGEPVAWPVEGPLADLSVGRHGVSLSSEDHFAVYQEVYVEPGRRTDLRLQLVERPRPWYTRWWTWTAFGTLVAAGVTAVVLLTEDAPDDGEVVVTVE